MERKPDHWCKKEVQKFGGDLKTQWVYEFRSINTFVFVCYSWVNVTSLWLPSPRDLISYCRHTVLHPLPILITLTFRIFQRLSLGPSQEHLQPRTGRGLRHLFFWKKSFHEFQAQKVKHNPSPGDCVGDCNVHSVSYRDVGRSHKHAYFPQMEEIGMGCFANRVWNQIIYFTTFYC